MTRKADGLIVRAEIRVVSGDSGRAAAAAQCRALRALLAALQERHADEAQAPLSSDPVGGDVPFQSVTAVQERGRGPKSVDPK